MDVTDVTAFGGRVPKGVIIFGGDYPASSAGADAVNAVNMVGCYDGAHSSCSSAYSLDNTTSSDCGQEWSGAAVLNTVNSYVRATATCFIPNGIRLNFTNVGAGVAYRFTAIFFGGRDVRAAVGTGANATGNGNVGVNTGFQPDLVFAHTQWTANNSEVGTFNDMGYATGWATNGNGQMGVCWADDDALTAGPAPSSYVHPSAALPFAVATTGALGGAVSVTNFNASGFDLTTALGTLGSLTACRIGYLALKLGEADVKVQAGTTKTSTGTQNYTGFGFDPDTLFLLGSTNTSVSAGGRDTTAGSGYCIGAANATVQGVSATAVNPSLDPSDTYQAHVNGSVLALGNNTGCQEHLADVDAFITDGVRLDYTAAGAGAKQLIMVGIAANSTPAALNDVYAQVVTFAQAAKGGVDISVDLGGRVPKAVIIVSANHDPANDATETAAPHRGARFDVAMAVLGGAQQSQQGATLDHNSSTQVNSRQYQNVTSVFSGSTFSQDWDVRVRGFTHDIVKIGFDNMPISIGTNRRFTMLVLAGEDVEAHLNEQNLGTGTSAIDVTAPGFEPDIVFASTAFRTATSTASPAMRGFGVGINDGADTQRCFTDIESAGTLTGARPGGVTRDNRIAARITAGTPPTAVYDVTIGTYDSTGYSVTPSANAGSEIVSFLAVKMPGIRMHLDDFLTKATTGVESYTGAGFTPRVALLAGGGNTSINTPQGATAALASRYMAMVADAADPTKVGVHSHRNQNGAAPTVASTKSLDDGHVIIGSSGANFADELGEFDGFTTDGFDVDYTATTGAHYFLALMLDWDDDTVPPSPAFQVEQSGLLVVGLHSAEAHVFHSGAIIVGKQEAEGGVLQSGILAVGKVLQRPFNWVLPEVPISEQWDWRTDIITSDNGTEQRIAIRSTPRVTVTHKFALDNRPDLRRVFRAMWTELGKPIPVPHWPWRTKLTAPTTLGQSRIYFDPAKTNLRDGGFMFIKEGDTFQIVRIKTVYADGARLTDTIGPAFTVNADVYPLTYNFAQTGVALKRTAPDTWGEGEYRAMDAATIGPVINFYDDEVVLPECNGLVILDRRPIGNDFEDAIDTGAKQLDIGAGKNTYVSPWKRGDWVSERTFLMHRLSGYTDVQWFRTFADYCKGSCVPFLMPSWRDDYDLASVPADGATTVTLTGDEFLTYVWPHTGLRYIAFEHADGLIVRQVTAAVASGANTALTLGEALPTPMPDVLKVSQVALSRVANDSMSLTHYPLYSTATFGIRTTDE